MAKEIPFCGFLAIETDRIVSPEAAERIAIKQGVKAAAGHR